MTERNVDRLLQRKNLGDARYQQRRNNRRDGGLDPAELKIADDALRLDAAEPIVARRHLLLHSWPPFCQRHKFRRQRCQAGLLFSSLTAFR